MYVGEARKNKQTNVAVIPAVDPNASRSHIQRFFCTSTLFKKLSNTFFQTISQGPPLCVGGFTQQFRPAPPLYVGGFMQHMTLFLSFFFPLFFLSLDLSIYLYFSFIFPFSMKLLFYGTIFITMVRLSEMLCFHMV